MTESPSGDIWILTGERGAGKSTVCARLAGLARESGYAVRGLLTERGSPTAIGDGCRAGSAAAESRFVVDLATGERFLFGSQGPAVTGTPAVAPPVSDRAGADGSEVCTEEALPGWLLDADAWARGNEILAAATPCDLLIVDELGPLELQAGRGWIEAFAVLASRHFAASLVVCRPWLVDELVRRVADPVATVIHVDPESRDALPARLLAELRGSGPECPARGS